MAGFLVIGTVPHAGYIVASVVPEFSQFRLCRRALSGQLTEMAHEIFRLVHVGSDRFSPQYRHHV